MSRNPTSQKPASFKYVFSWRLSFPILLFKQYAFFLPFLPLFISHKLSKVWWMDIHTYIHTMYLFSDACWLACIRFTYTRYCTKLFIIFWKDFFSISTAQSTQFLKKKALKLICRMMPRQRITNEPIMQNEKKILRGFLACLGFFYPFP